jgi:hypothetical protein
MMAAKAPSTRTTRLRNASAKNWKIPGFDEPFVQDPLTFFEKNEFLALVARALEDSVAGGMDLDAVLTLLGMDEAQLKGLVTGDLGGDALMLASSLFNVITRLVASGPTLLEDLYLIALSIPPEKREDVRPRLRMIDDDTGFGVLETFVEQNTTTIRDFFPRWRALLETMGRKLRVPDTSPTSTD